jgi:hypothetical protein
MKLGENLDTSIVEKKIDKQQPHQCALLIYTVSAIMQLNTFYIQPIFPPNSQGPLVILKP